MLRAVYLIVNQAWIVMFGDSMISVSDQFFFDTRGELDTALAGCGLKREPDGVISIS